MIYAQLGKLYLCSIVKGGEWNSKEGFTFKEQPITEGLALERSDGKSRLVIARLHYDAYNDEYELESIGDRLMQALTSENLSDAAFLCRYAERIMRDEYNRLNTEND